MCACDALCSGWALWSIPIWRCSQFFAAGNLKQKRFGIFLDELTQVKNTDFGHAIVGAACIIVLSEEEVLYVAIIRQLISVIFTAQCDALLR